MQGLFDFMLCVPVHCSTHVQALCQAILYHSVPLLSCAQAQQYLGRAIQAGEHNPREDTEAAMDLYKGSWNLCGAATVVQYGPRKVFLIIVMMSMIVLSLSPQKVVA